MLRSPRIHAEGRGPRAPFSAVRLPAPETKTASPTRRADREALTSRRHSLSTAQFDATKAGGYDLAHARGQDESRVDETARGGAVLPADPASAANRRRVPRSGSTGTENRQARERTFSA
jgi:hypothetical protein